jgi:trafficking protein particle complex subunit 13
MRVEMETAANRTLLNEVGGSSERLAALASLETIVHFEIKELGQHILACVVQYRTPQGETREFRKYYKFPVRKAAFYVLYSRD